MSTFGPVPSRRLGRSLGINHIPPKICSYACVYCQLGRTITMQARRTAFYEPEEILAAARQKVAAVKERGQRIDYLTLVPDGEPTLDANLGRQIDLLRPLGIPIAVISNASLIWRPDVREELATADWVSLKVDAVQEAVWRRIDRPHGALRLEGILDGMLAFAQSYEGELVTETMLVAGANDGERQVGEVAEFLARLDPAVAYLAIPTRPPAEPWVGAPDEQAILRAYRIVGGKVRRAEHLIGYEGNEFASTGNVAEDLLAITAVHPMREDAVHELLARAGLGWDLVAGLVGRGLLVEAEFEGHRFCMRRLGRSHAPEAHSR